MIRLPVRPKDPKNKRLRLKDFLRKCANRMRKEPTDSEAKATIILRALGFEFIQQSVHHRYIADFELPGMVILEIDGGYHDNPKQRRRDQKKERWFVRNGFTVIRVRNEDVGKSCLEEVLEGVGKKFTRGEPWK